MKNLPSGCPATTIEALLAETAWLRRLAQSLVRESTRADDLLQETWLRALQHSPRTSRNLRGWLARIARNAALQFGRSERSREQREVLVARDIVCPADDAVERAELQRRLVNAVLGLGEPYRRTLVLAYFEGLNASEIGMLLSTPPSTVRTHVKRGLDLVRQELDRDSGGDRSWFGALAAFATAPPRPTTSGASTATISGGIAVMGAKSKLALAALAIAAFSTAVLNRDALFEEAPGTTATPPVAVAGPNTHSTDDEIAAPALPVPIANEGSRAEVAEASTGSVVVRVTWADDDAPAAYVSGFVRWGGGTAAAQERGFVTNADGTARCDRLPCTKVSISIDRGAQAHTEIRGGEDSEVALEIPLGVHIRGTVVDDRGDSVPSAEIWLGHTPMSYPAGLADARGQFFLRSVSLPASVGARDREHVPSSFRQLQFGEPGDTVEVQLVLGSLGGAVSGSVRSIDGSPLRDALVRIGNENRHYISLPDGARGFGPPRLSVITNEQGAFLAQGLETGSLDVEVRSPDHAWWNGRVEVAEGRTSEIEIALERGASLAGQVLDLEGNPAVDVLITIGRVDWHDFDWFARTSEGGSFRFENLPAGTRHILANGDSRGRAIAMVELRDAEESRLDLRLDRGRTLSGRVVDELDRPLAGWRVWGSTEQERYATPEWSPGWARTKTDERGEFLLCNLPDEELRLDVLQPDRPGAPALLSLEGVRPGTTGLVLKVESQELPTSWIEGIVLDSRNEPVPRALVVASQVANRGNSGSHFELTDRDTGRFRLGPLPPGTYQVRIEATGFPAPDIAPQHLPRGQTLDLGTIRIDQGGSVLLRLSRAGGQPVGEPNLGLYTELGVFVDVLRVEGDHARSGPLRPGTYNLIVRDGPSVKPARSIELRVEAGRETELEVALEGPPP